MVGGPDRILLEDLVVRNYYLPGGCSVFVEKYVAHRNPKYWKNPEVDVCYTVIKSLNLNIKIICFCIHKLQLFRSWSKLEILRQKTLRFCINGHISYIWNNIFLVCLPFGNMAENCNSWFFHLRKTWLGDYACILTIIVWTNLRELIVRKNAAWKLSFLKPTFPGLLSNFMNTINSLFCRFLTHIVSTNVSRKKSLQVSIFPSRLVHETALGKYSPKFKSN